MRELDTPRDTHFQVRGDFLRLGEPLEPNVPSVLPKCFGENDRRTRLDLARWLTRADHPLTSRVRVNRIWMRLFGTGLVETENDFGIQGTLPTHPDLLNWLAAEFVRQEWSTKQILRCIANSATYRQASQARPEAAKMDPRNRLLWRQNRLRVEGEIVRDLGLAASGFLSDKIGGPSVRPPQPDGVATFSQGGSAWTVSQGNDRYRRGMYTFFQRSAPYPMLTTFDSPKFNQTCTRRNRSNTPLQSLILANDEAMFEMTCALADGILRESAESHTDADRLVRMFRLCLARPPRDVERDYLVGFLHDQRQNFAEKPEAAKLVAAGLSVLTSAVETAVWVATARVLLNLDEFITRE